jgi:hypothetical protein
VLHVRADGEDLCRRGSDEVGCRGLARRRAQAAALMRRRAGVAAALRPGRDHLADVRLVDAVDLVALAGHALPALAPSSASHGFIRMVLAHPADAFADRASRVHALDRPLNDDAAENVAEEGVVRSRLKRPPQSWGYVAAVALRRPHQEVLSNEEN